MDRLCVVTGSSSGIGQALCEALLERQWMVLGVARRQVEFNSPLYSHLCFDLSKPVDLAALLDELKVRIDTQHLQTLALVNNAAVSGQLKRVGSQETDQMMADFHLNVVAPMGLMNGCRAHWPSQRKLKVVNLSSAAAHTPLDGMSDYCASKAALRIAGQVCAQEAESEGALLSLLSYEPGVVESAMQARARRQSSSDFPSADFFRQIHAEGRLITPAQAVVPIVRFLEAPEQPHYSESRYSPD